MTRSILLTLTLLGCTAWMVAQSTPSSSYPSSSGSSSSQTSQTGSQTSTGQTGAETSSGMNGSETTLQGCLASSGGGYTLTDASGTQYTLEGDTSQLSSHVNSEVEVKGTSSSSSSASTGSSSAGSSESASSPSSGAAAAHTFNVTKVKKISSSCTSGK